MKVILMMNAGPVVSRSRRGRSRTSRRASRSWANFQKKLQMDEWVDGQGHEQPDEAKLVQEPARIDARHRQHLPGVEGTLAGFSIVEVPSAARVSSTAPKPSAAPGPGGAPLNALPIEVREVQCAPPPSSRTDELTRARR